MDSDQTSNKIEGPVEATMMGEDYYQILSVIGSGKSSDEEENEEKTKAFNVEICETDEQMMKRKETVILMSLKRKAELEAKRAIKENELARQREEAARKKELEEHKKLEHKLKREAILEQYRLKKAAEAAAASDSSSVASSNNNHTMTLSQKGKASLHASSDSSTNSSNNNHTMTLSQKAKSSQSQSTWTLYTGPKLFARPTTKTNLVTIKNAILKALEGAANAKTLKRTQDTIANAKGCSHFLILFRSRHQFRGLYEYDEKQKLISKLDGVGPKSIKNEDILKYFKFDSPRREFIEVQTRHISPTIIALTIQDHLWSKMLSSRPSTQV